MRAIEGTTARRGVSREPGGNGMFGDGFEQSTILRTGPDRGLRGRAAGGARSRRRSGDEVHDRSVSAAEAGAVRRHFALKEIRWPQQTRAGNPSLTIGDENLSGPGAASYRSMFDPAPKRSPQTL